MIDVELEELFAERLQHHVAGGSAYEAEQLGRLHHLKQIGEVELQIARDAIAVIAAAAILQRLEQAEHPGQLAIRNWIDPLSHQVRSSINEKTLSTSTLKASVRRSRGRGISTLISAARRPGCDDITRVRS